MEIYLFGAMVILPPLIVAIIFTQLDSKCKGIYEKREEEE